MMEGGGYTNYRFEFDMIMPAQGKGISGWIVQAKDPDNFLLLQLQSSDSEYNSPEHKTKPNTLRIVPRLNGQHFVEDPVTLSLDIRKGEKYHIKTECVNNNVSIWVNGQKIASYKSKFSGGWMGFRVSGAVDQGIFSNICLKKL
ncbi:DUF6250 domain-containing protein [Niabella ginsengisoli]|uniref:DUF1080 domain-containing protein n=1 Tax=Niabella ginsengisoli TaxID=522298 RepID=A0ABS9SIK4_9BACT|nr:hypothetical protein [Niabella ginsengisoli]MCH5598009.1 hypothetical protein [Niabella ginsengisoli]